MRFFRKKSDGTTTEQKKSKEPQKVNKYKAECCECGYTFWITYLKDKEIEYTLKDNGWEHTDKGYKCPRCIALGNKDADGKH